MPPFDSLIEWFGVRGEENKGRDRTSAQNPRPLTAGTPLLIFRLSEKHRIKLKKNEEKTNINEPNLKKSRESLIYGKKIERFKVIFLCFIHSIRQCFPLFIFLEICPYHWDNSSCVL